MSNTFNINTLFVSGQNINSLFYPYSNPNNFVQSGSFSSVNGVTGISVTGGSPITGNVSFTGIGGMQLIQLGNTIEFSGGGGGSNVINNFYNINSGSGTYFYQTGLQSGISSQFIGFPYNLGNNPFVSTTFCNSIDNNIFVSQISGIVSTGFWITLSEVTNTTGYNLNVIASTTNTGIATNVIINNSNLISQPSWSTLNWNPITIWTANTNVIEDKQKLILTGNTILNITGLYNGWCGVLKTIQSGISSSGYLMNISGYTNTLIKMIVINSGNGIVGLTMNSGSVDVLGFEFDGTNLLTTIGNNFS